MLLDICNRQGVMVMMQKRLHEKCKALIALKYTSLIGSFILARCLRCTAIVLIAFLLLGIVYGKPAECKSDSSSKPTMKSKYGGMLQQNARCAVTTRWDTLQYNADALWVASYIELYKERGRSLELGATYLALTDGSGKVLDYRECDRLISFTVNTVVPMGAGTFRTVSIITEHDSEGFEILTITNGAGGYRFRPLFKISTKASNILIEDIDGDQLPEVLIPCSPTIGYYGLTGIDGMPITLDIRIPKTKSGFITLWLSFTTYSITRYEFLEMED
jgi:hypothetical protein